ncbi:MAG TPA: class I SAM-dependent methyltransferase, partial [Pseudonocardiaceae bacterium]
MAYQVTASDVAFLRATAGADALAAMADRPLTDRLADATAARAVAGDRFAPVLETAVLRRKAVAKLADPAR